MPNQNLERSCAKLGFELAEAAKGDGMLSKSDKTKIVNTINKAVGVLNADGPFAYLVWLEYKNSLNPKIEDKEGNVAKLIHQKSYDILSEEGFIDATQWTDGWKKLKKIFIGKENVAGICDNIHQMFFVKGILEKMLTYALYSAKAFKAAESPSTGSEKDNDTPVEEES
ncbi:MAG: hypothetical protein ABIF11_01775 [Nitrospirota bacterium]